MHVWHGLYIYTLTAGWINRLSIINNDNAIDFRTCRSSTSQPVMMIISKYTMASQVPICSLCSHYSSFLFCWLLTYLCQRFVVNTWPRIWLLQFPWYLFYCYQQLKLYSFLHLKWHCGVLLSYTGWRCAGPSLCQLCLSVSSVLL